MFTGIVEEVGRVAGMGPAGGAARLRVDLGAVCDGVRLGDSVAVNGACLTVARLEPPTAEFDVSAETLERTTLGSFAPGREVNLERSLRVGDRMGGHFVLGHVDVVGAVSALKRSSGQVTLTVSAPREIVAQLIPKGSVAVDGVSLTVADIAAEGFSVALIPHTIEHTALRSASAGDRVNIELDVIGKYVARLLAAARGGPAPGRISEEFLRDHGFA